MKKTRKIMVWKMFIILMFCCLWGGIGANAEKKPWVKLDNSTLTFQYGDKKKLDKNEYWLNEGSNNPGWYYNSNVITEVVFDESFAQARPTSCYFWFVSCEKLTTIKGIENLNTSNVTNMYGMFCECKGLQSLDVSKLNTSNVTNMSYMFYNCKGLKSLNLSNFNTSKVTDMSYMFYKCKGLSSLDVSKFNTSNVTNMSNMFNNCYRFKSLDLSNFNTSKVTDMSYMFFECTNLNTLKVSNFDTSNVTDMSCMFAYITWLQSLDISNFSTSNVRYMTGMFESCSLLRKIVISKFDRKNLLMTRDMLNSCTATIYCSISEVSTESVFAKNDMVPYVKINPDAEYGTLCVPIKSTLEKGHFWGFDKLYTVTEHDATEGKIKLKEATSIEPGVPYIYHRTTGNTPVDNTVSFAVNMKDLNRSNPKNDGFLKGTYESITAPSGSYVLQTDGMFHLVERGNTSIKVGEYQAYLDFGSEQNSDVYVMELNNKETTSINGVYDNANSMAPTTYYDLMGRRVNSPAKGQIYIVNGKKVMF